METALREVPRTAPRYAAVGRVSTRRCGIARSRAGTTPRSGTRWPPPARLGPRRRRLPGGRATAPAAHRSPGATSQLLDRRAGQQHAQAEAAPPGGEPHGRKDEDAAAVWLELVVQDGVELAGGRVEDGFGDPAKVGVLAVEHAGRIGRASCRERG